MKSILFYFIVTATAFSGINEPGLSVIIEGRAASFTPKLKDFSKVYPEKILAPTGGIGFGSRTTFLMARYEKFNSSGKSIISGAPITGKAEWEELFYSLGLRVYSEFGIYLELNYLIASVSEKISTESSEYPVLSNEFSDENLPGFGLALGLSLPIMKILYLTAEINYKSVELRRDYPPDTVQQIGGAGFNFGLMLVL